MNMDGWMPKIHGIPKKSPPLSSIILNMIFDFLIFNTKIKQSMVVYRTTLNVVGCIQVETDHKR